MSHFDYSTVCMWLSLQFFSVPVWSKQKGSSLGRMAESLIGVLSVNAASALSYSPSPHWGGSLTDSQMSGEQGKWKEGMCGEEASSAVNPTPTISSRCPPVISLLFVYVLLLVVIAPSPVEILHSPSYTSLSHLQSPHSSPLSLGDCRLAACRMSKTE